MKMANLTVQEHRNRADTWRAVAVGTFCCGVFMGIMAVPVALVTMQQLPSIYPFMVLGLMSFVIGLPWIPIHLHEKHLPHE